MSDNFDLDPQSWAQLRELLQVGMDLPAAERDGWLAQLEARDATLRPRLQQLLQHADAGTQNDALGTLPKLIGLTPPVSPDSTHRADDLIGPYRLQRVLGEGGMARVWLAERTDVLTERRVAMKLPHAALLGPRQSAQLSERLAREQSARQPDRAPRLEAVELLQETPNVAAEDLVLCSRTTDAVALLKPLVENASDLMGPDVPMVGFYSADIARFQHEADEVADSLVYAERSLAIVSKVADKNSYTVAGAKLHIARAAGTTPFT